MRTADLLASTMTEAQLQDAIIDLARTLGWTIAHFRPARTTHGWRTPVAADGAGFPDLVLCRPPRVLFAELKREKGRTSLGQEMWLRALARCPGVTTALWRPSDWLSGEIERELRA